MPELNPPGERQQRHRQNHRAAAEIQQHDQVPAVFAVNDDAGEGKENQRRHGLQHQQLAQRHL